MKLDKLDKANKLHIYANIVEYETILYIYNGRSPKPHRKLYKMYLAEAQRTFSSIVQKAPDEQHIFPIRRKIRARLTMLTKRLGNASDCM